MTVTVTKPTGHSIYLGRYDEFNVENLSKKLNKLLKEAEEDGWRDCTITFESTLEPYEDWPGDVEVIVNGTRNMTQEELKAVEEENNLKELAEELGVTIYEASIYKKLKKMGKV